ncbi:DNA-3-methyladenine glycosylase I [Alisedimentitalea sp. MJ-SS2]|uniref:DNA-3-methyladenine glycosylase I n=1 Tax=Aliisedimentitalea sp. MJ-SS2 TaxID=3049795 RepID=UPI00290B0ECD|nr:DNA-3-methyladenine glycosylase I [Alisedimentitalea sp. MJ-SS2]MDU8926353.1 DNA-3-methyladenine glycosylase I [Alisedimentitalea sp. MJ-SS2]
MHRYDEILAMAAERKGGFGAVLEDIPIPKTAAEIADIPDAQWLASMAEGIFQTGLAWTVVRNKWPGIVEAFHGFDVAKLAMMSDEWYDELLADTRIIRSAPKVRAIQQNAVFIQEVTAEVGGFGRKVANWPKEDFAGLVQWLKKSGSRLGGQVGAYSMRRMGVDSFIMSGSVVARLVAEGVVSKSPTSQKDWAAVQAAFNTWVEQSGESLTTISRVLAKSIDV